MSGATATAPRTAAPPNLVLRLAERKAPVEQLADELLRLRRKGFPFELAWKRAVRAIQWPETKESRRQWKAVILGGKTYWGICYRNEGIRLTLQQIIDAMSCGTDLL